MADNQVLVLGGSGFIGRHVVRELLQQSQPVRALTRQQEKVHRLFGDQVDVCYGDLKDSASLERAVTGCDSLINVAGCYEFGPSAHQRLQQANVDGIRNLLRAWNFKPGRFVHVSTAGIWDQHEGTDLELTPIPPYGYYKQTKYAGEQLVRTAAREGMNAVIVSPTCPVGAEDETPTPTGRMICDFIHGKFPVSSRTGINLIHVADLAAGIVKAWQQAPGVGPYILGDQNFWLDELFAALSPLVDQPVPRWTAPHPLIRLAGFCGEMLDQAVPGFSQRTQLCRETAWLSTRAQFFDLTATQQELGWQPQRGVHQALQEAVQWYQKTSAPDELQLFEQDESKVCHTVGEVADLAREAKSPEPPGSPTPATVRSLLRSQSYTPSDL